eukprot:9374436-Alexandrium_andersonii.AAC.1
MVTWAQLATEVVQTEWPDCAVIASMRVFHLADSASSGSELCPDTVACSDVDLDRLAVACDVDRRAFARQFEFVRPYAQKEAAARKCDNRQAWREALFRLPGA